MRFDFLLAFVFYPAWLAAGALDYLCHRRSSIERTSGVVEGVYHLAQFATIAIIVLGIAFFEGGGIVFAIVLASGIAHLLLSYFDVRYTQRLRFISPLEQHVHAVLDIVPLAAIAVWIALEWEGAQDFWVWRLRTPMLSALEISAVLISVFIIAFGPVLEEFIRTLRYAARCRRGQVMADAP